MIIGKLRLLFYVNIFLCQLDSFSAMADVEGEDSNTIPFSEEIQRVGLKYGIIYGSLYSSFYLHYCLPNFVPLDLGGCKRGAAIGSDPNTVQVKYDYSLGRKDAGYAMLEASGAFIYPFPVNVGVAGKTPYLVQYNELEKQTKTQGRLLIESNDKVKNIYEGLVRYESKRLPASWRLWIPERREECKTKLGNPPLFSCGSLVCTTNIDLGNGWLVQAQFNESALSDWRNFYIGLNRAINEIFKSN